MVSKQEKQRRKNMQKREEEKDPRDMCVCGKRDYEQDDVLNTFPSWEHPTYGWIYGLIRECSNCHQTYTDVPPMA